MEKNRPAEAPDGVEVDWLVLDLNSFFASCEQQANPHLRNRPIGIVPMQDVDTTCILAASYEAKHFGVKTGTSVRDAKDMCPGIILLPACHKKYTHYHHKVMRAIEECTPIQSIMSIDEVACKLTGSQRQPENAVKLAQKIKAHIRDTVGECLTSSIGLAPNILLAKVGSDMQKPDGLVVIRPCDLPHKLMHLKLQDFSGIGPRTEKRLNYAGIFSVKDLYGCERKHLRAIWGGVEGERFHAKIWGFNVNRAETQKSVIGHQHVLEPYLRNTGAAYDVLHHLLMKAAERLRHSNYYCKRLSVHVKLDFKRGHWVRETDFREIQDTQFLLHVLHELWQEYPGHRPLRVGVMLHGLVAAAAHQGDLFEKTKPKQLYEAIDGINKKFGRHTVNFGLNDYVRQKVGRDKIAFQSVPDNSYM